jgi:hypothetical protein
MIQDDWTQGKDGWEILDDPRAKVTGVRNYSDGEYSEETGEYFNNERTRSIAPNAFKDEDDMIQKMKSAPLKYLSSEEMQNINNSDVGEILDASENGGKEGMIELGRIKAKEYGKDWDRLEKGIASNSPVPAPMVLKDKRGNLYLLAGNTRLMSFTAYGKKLPVKIIDYNGVFMVNEDKIRGGKADNMTKEDIAKKFGVTVAKINKELEMGIKVELEHTTSKRLAKEIAMDHLTEIPDYYTRLKKMEKEGESHWKKREKKVDESIRDYITDLVRMNLKD